MVVFRSMNQYHEGTLEFQNGGYQHDIRRYACKITKRESLYAGADAGAADPQGERRLSAGAERTEPADHRAAARGKIAMAHRAATDEICVTGGMGNAHQAKGGDSSESPPAVFWLQKTLLAKFCSRSRR